MALVLLSPLPSFAEGEKIKEQPWMNEAYDDYDEKLTQHADLHITRNGRTYLIDLLYSRSDDVLTTLKEIFESDLSSGNITLSHNSATNSILARFAEEPDQSLVDELCDSLWNFRRHELVQVHSQFSHCIIVVGTFDDDFLQM